MYCSLNLFLQTLGKLPILLFFVGIFLSFFGYKMRKIFSIIFSIVIGFFIGTTIGIFKFKSSIIAFIFSVILSTSFSFFAYIYYKYFKYIFIAILLILFFIYLPFFILIDIISIELFKIKLYIYICSLIILISLIISYKFTNIMTIISTSFTGSIMLLYPIFYTFFHINKFTLLKIILIIIVPIISFLFQIYSLKNKKYKT